MTRKTFLKAAGAASAAALLTPEKLAATIHSPVYPQGALLRKARREGRKYLNPVPTETVLPGQNLRMLRDWLGGDQERTPAAPIGPFRTDPALYASPPTTGLRLTWFGHSSSLLEIDGYRLLLDPVWGERASVTSMAGPKRFFPPTLAIAELPKLDAVLISHDHYDHLDAPTIRELAALPVPFFCPLGVGAHLLDWGISADRITELDWTDEARIGADLRLIALPTRHGSGRINLPNQTLWASYALMGPKHKVYFGADSGPCDALFQEIGAAYGPFDLTMLEIGAYDAQWPYIHMGPDNAVRTHQLLGGGLMMPIHWGLFNLAFHGWREPVEQVLALAEPLDLPLFLPMPGAPTDVTLGGMIARWWEGPLPA
jgi:L-ascorbate metabolism protein UlaG (beta-lactamase superfamily)